MIFGQTSAPTGFTKLVDQDNAALRVVSGSVGNGGSVNFTTAFASQTPAGSVSVSGGSVGSFTLTTNEIPSHSHTVPITPDNCGGPNTPARYAGNPSTTTASGSTGGGGGHSHSFSAPTASFSGTAINLAVKYVDVIRATKD
jgi:hypothetical protein